MLDDLPEDYNPQQIDPALLTFEEWRNIVDKDRKSHPSSAYNVNLDELSKHPVTGQLLSKDKWPKLIRTIDRHGLTFEIRLGLEKNHYAKKQPNGIDFERINGEVQYYTDEETKRLGRSLYEWSLAIFHGDKRIASVQDEWGCMLVMVAKEYRNFGFGTYLTKLAYKIEPTKPSGGMTPAGFKTFARVHAEFVQDALRDGTYSNLVKDGKLTMERVQEIVHSANPIKQQKEPERNLNSDDPNDWLLYVGGYGDFILYDRKLRELLQDDGRYSHFTDAMIKGIAYVMHQGHRNTAFLKVFGGDSEKIKRLLMSCVIEFSLREKTNFYVEPHEIADIPPDMASVSPQADKSIGFTAHLATPTGKRIDYDAFGAEERKWRKSFDRYDEFLHQMMEMAYAKYGN